MSRVVPFPGSRQEPDKPNQGVSLEAQVRRLRANIDAKPRIEKASDRRAVAQALETMLKRLEGRDISRLDVLREAGMARPGESTKPLYRLTLPASLDENGRARREAKLTQKIKPYLTVMNAVAKLAEQDERVLLCELLQGTRYETIEPATGDVDPCWETMAEWLRLMAGSIARRHDLKTYFEAWERYGLEDEGDDDTLYTEWCRPWRTAFVNGHCVRDSLARYLPKVLIAHHHLDGAKYKVQIAAADRTTGGQVPHLAWNAEEVPPGYLVEESTARLGRTLWLCLAPIGPGGAVVPAFLERRWLDVAVPASFLQLFPRPDGGFNSWTRPEAKLVQAQIEPAQWFDLAIFHYTDDETTEAHVRVISRTHPMKPFTITTYIEPGASYFNRRLLQAVDPMWCKYYLSPKGFVDTTSEPDLNESFCEHEDVQDNFISTDIPTMMPIDSIGGNLEAHLLRGEGLGFNIESHLDVSAEYRASRVKAFLEQSERDRDEQIERAKQRWKE